MAVSSVGGSSVSSIYGNRNIISGLASGLDTESMIENSVAGYKTKIQSLIKQQTKIQWQQDAYRSVTDKLSGIMDKYMSYSSKTNLSSPSFFTKAVTTTTSGDFKDCLSATGKSTSDIRVNAVKQLATSAQYKVSASRLSNGTATGKAIQWADEADPTVDVSTVAGSLTLSYGGTNVSIDFGETEKFDTAQDMVDAIQSQLENQSITYSNGTRKKASEAISVKLDSNGKVLFADKTLGGNSVYISSVSGAIKDTLNIKTGREDGGSFSTKDAEGNAIELSEKKAMEDYLKGKKVDVSVDGVTKTLTLGEGIHNIDDLVAELQNGIDKAFGTGKVTVSLTSDKALDFAPEAGSHVTVDSYDSVGEIFGMGKGGVSSYINNSMTLGSILGEDSTGMGLKGLTALKADGVSSNADVITKDGKHYDPKGNRIEYMDVTNEDGTTGKDWMRVDADGNLLYDLKINDVSVGQFSKDTAFESVLVAINNNNDVELNASYSKMTNKFTFTSQVTGANSRIEMNDGLASALFGNTIGGEGIEKGEYIDGDDAIVNVTVNGDNITLKRSSNVIDMDGLSVTLKDTFNEDKIVTTPTVDPETGRLNMTVDKEKTEANVSAMEASHESVSFTTRADADTIVDAIKSFVEDYNAVAKEIHDAYSTQPAYKNSSTHTKYEPLSDEDKEGMSETAIENYEKKAKQGILFGDSNFSSLYSKLLTAITPGGMDRKEMEAIGLTTTYSDGITSLSLDESKLRSALDGNPDRVKEVFSKSKEYGATTDGMTARLKTVLNMYASTSIANPGILVSHAGTTKKSVTLLNNTLQKKINNLDDQIDRWQDKMSDKIDYYTKQFTALEQLMQQMNSQSSTLAGLMGTGG